MRGAALPAALLCIALALALAYAPRRALAPALLAVSASAVVAMAFPLNPSREIAFLGCWASVVVSALAVHLPGGLKTWPAILLAANAGVWVGSVISWEGAPTDLLRVVPCALLSLPTRWVVARGWGLALKVASSWLIAIAILAALLPATGTPGYMPDHMG